MCLVTEIQMFLKRCRKRMVFYMSTMFMRDCMMGECFRVLPVRAECLPCQVIVVFNVHGSMHHNNILVYNSNKMHKSQSLFNLATALHVSGVIITHLQEHKTTVTTASGNRYTVLLSVAIVEELELIWMCCGWQLSDKINSVTCASCWIYILEYNFDKY